MTFSCTLEFNPTAFSGYLDPSYYRNLAFSFDQEVEVECRTFGYRFKGRDCQLPLDQGRLTGSFILRIKRVNKDNQTEINYGLRLRVSLVSNAHLTNQFPYDPTLDVTLPWNTIRSLRKLDHCILTITKQSDHHVVQPRLCLKSPRTSCNFHTNVEIDPGTHCIWSRTLSMPKEGDDELDSDWVDVRHYEVQEEPSGPFHAVVMMLSGLGSWLGLSGQIIEAGEEPARNDTENDYDEMK